MSPTAGNPGQPQSSLEGVIGAAGVGAGVGTGVGVGVGTGVGTGAGTAVGPITGRPGQPQSVEASVPMLQVTTHAQRVRRKATLVARPRDTGHGLHLAGITN